MNAWRTPERIRTMHFADQRADINGDRRPTEPGWRGTPAPMPRKQAAVPRDDGRGFDDPHGIPPAAPDSGEHHPEESVGSAQPKPSRRGLLEDSELMAEGEDLRFEFGSRSETGPNHRKEGRNARTHDFVKSYQQRRASSIATISTRFSVGTGRLIVENCRLLSSPRVDSVWRGHL